MEVGERIKFRPAGRLFMSQFTTKWGESTWLYAISDKDGNRYVFFHPVKRGLLMLSDDSEIQATVKGFSEYNGRPQVNLKNVKITNHGKEKV